MHSDRGPAQDIHNEPLQPFWQNVTQSDAVEDAKTITENREDMVCWKDEDDDTPSMPLPPGEPTFRLGDDPPGLALVPLRTKQAELIRCARARTVHKQEKHRIPCWGIVCALIRTLPLPSLTPCGGRVSRWRVCQSLQRASLCRSHEYQLQKY